MDIFWYLLGIATPLVATGTLGIVASMTDSVNAKEDRPIASKMLIAGLFIIIIAFLVR